MIVGLRMTIPEDTTPDANHGARQTPQTKMLLAAQLLERHLARLEILRRISVEVPEKDARRLLEDIRAEVRSSRVRVPSRLAEWVIQVTPRMSRFATVETARRASTLRVVRATTKPVQHGQHHRRRDA